MLSHMEMPPVISQSLWLLLYSFIKMHSPHVIRDNRVTYSIRMRVGRQVLVKSGYVGSLYSLCRWL